MTNSRPARETSASASITGRDAKANPITVTTSAVITLIAIITQVITRATVIAIIVGKMGDGTKDVGAAALRVGRTVAKRRRTQEMRTTDNRLTL